MEEELKWNVKKSVESLKRQSSRFADKRYIYDGMDVVQERDWNNDVTANYTRVGNIGGLLGKSTPNGTGSDHVYYHYDGSGNVVQLTSSAGNSVGEYSYDAYGNATRVWGYAATANTYRFSTKEWHGFTGLYSYGYRFYSPQLGRWINRDPIREAGGLNLYGFVGNNPSSLVDEYGLRFRYYPVNQGDPHSSTKALKGPNWPVNIVGGTPSERHRTVEALKKIFNSDVGNRLRNYARRNDITATIRFNNRGEINGNTNNGDVNLDLNAGPGHRPLLKEGPCSGTQGPPVWKVPDDDVLIIHELGHALGQIGDTPFPGNQMDTVNQVENPYRAETGRGPRLQYPGYPVGTPKSLLR